MDLTANLHRVPWTGHKPNWNSDATKKTNIRCHGMRAILKHFLSIHFPVRPLYSLVLHFLTLTLKQHTKSPQHHKRVLPVAFLQVLMHPHPTNKVQASWSNQN